MSVLLKNRCLSDRPKSLPENGRGILGAATESMASHTGEMIGGPKMCGAWVSPKNVMEHSFLEPIKIVFTT